MAIDPVHRALVEVATGQRGDGLRREEGVGRLGRDEPAARATEADIGRLAGMDGALGGAGEGEVVLRFDDDTANADVPQMRWHIEDVDEVRAAGRRIPVGDDDLAVDAGAFELPRKAGHGAVDPADVARRIGVIAAIGDEADVRGRGHSAVGRSGGLVWLHELPGMTFQEAVRRGPLHIFRTHFAKASR
ncbi:MAG TPA: hypothetical protein VFF72_04005 [Caldimonas sp.]|nr:hypothetical protein [Caldimonas sp.]